MKKIMTTTTPEKPKINGMHFELLRRRQDDIYPKLILDINANHHFSSLALMRDAYEEVLDAIAEYAVPVGDKSDIFRRVPKVSIGRWCVSGRIVCDLIDCKNRSILFRTLRGLNWSVRDWY